jgi:fibro-slime domain-containing protein
MLRKLFGFGLPVAALVAFAIPVHADTLAVQWFTVASGTPDFNGGFCCSVNSNEVQSNLGPNGLPVSNGGLSDINLLTNELLWWTPNGTTTLATGTSTITFPSSGLNQNMFAPNGGGNTDQNGLFQTAILTGTLVATTGATITFGGDDDVLLVLNGQVVDQVGGVHSQSDTTYDLPSSGTYSLELFYADRQTVAANLQFSLTNASVSAVPEPATWAMMILGFCGVGFMSYRRKARASFRVA